MAAAGASDARAFARELRSATAIIAVRAAAAPARRAVVHRSIRRVAAQALDVCMRYALGFVTSVRACTRAPARVSARICGTVVSLCAVAIASAATSAAALSSATAATRAHRCARIATRARSSRRRHLLCTAICTVSAITNPAALAVAISTIRAYRVLLLIIPGWALECSTQAQVVDSRSSDTIEARYSNTSRHVRQRQARESTELAKARRIELVRELVRAGRLKKELRQLKRRIRLSPRLPHCRSCAPRPRFGITQSRALPLARSRSNKLLLALRSVRVASTTSLFAARAVSECNTALDTARRRTATICNVSRCLVERRRVARRQRTRAVTHRCSL